MGVQVLRGDGPTEEVFPQESVQRLHPSAARRKPSSITRTRGLPLRLGESGPGALVPEVRRFLVEKASEALFAQSPLLGATPGKCAAKGVKGKRPPL